MDSRKITAGSVTLPEHSKKQAPVGVPEPSSLAMLALGVGGVVAARTRAARRRSSKTTEQKP